MYNTDISKLRTPQLGQETNDFFLVFFYVVATYTILDTLWLLLIPKCVPGAPTALVVHHIFTFLLILVPYNLNQFAWHFAAALLVEFNTLTIILRRNVPRGTALHAVIEWLFIITTLVFRVIMFPVLTVFYYQEWIRYSILLDGKYWNIMLFTPIALGALSLMSFQWLYVYVKNLFVPKKKDNR
jgi:hypothetical protein